MCQGMRVLVKRQLGRFSFLPPSWCFQDKLRLSCMAASAFSHQAVLLVNYFLSEKLLHRSWYCKGVLMSMCIAFFSPENFIIFSFIFKWWPFDGNIISWYRFTWVHHFGNFTFLSKSDGCFSVAFLPFFLPFLRLVLISNGLCTGCPLSIITLSTPFYFLYQGDIKLPVLLLPELSSWWILLLKPFSN